jgi:hypothetical protein
MLTVSIPESVWSWHRATLVADARPVATPETLQARHLATRIPMWRAKA